MFADKKKGEGGWGFYLGHDSMTMTRGASGPKMPMRLVVYSWLEPCLVWCGWGDCFYQ